MPKKSKKPVTETLHCERGDHSWKRTKKGGSKPRSCPNHPRVLDPEEIEARQEKMREGRRKASLAKAEVAAEQITAMSQWIKADAKYHKIKREIEDGLREENELPMRPPAVLVIPSDGQYKLAREHGLIA